MAVTHTHTVWINARQSGLAGEIRYRVIDNDFNVVVPRSLPGVGVEEFVPAETPGVGSGIYRIDVDVNNEWIGFAIVVELPSLGMWEIESVGLANLIKHNGGPADPRIGMGDEDIDLILEKTSVNQS